MTKRLSTALLLGGYPVAVWAALRFVPMWRQRRLGRFLAFEAATGAVTTGLLLRGRKLEAAFNGAVLTGLALAWVVTNRR